MHTWFTALCATTRGAWAGSARMVCHASEPRYQSSLLAAQWQEIETIPVRAFFGGITATGSGVHKLSAAPDAGAGAVIIWVLGMHSVTE